jgi:DNA-binding IclR family transcriptional regulator
MCIDCAICFGNLVTKALGNATLAQATVDITSDKTMTRATKTPAVPALDKALTVLEELAESRIGLSLPELVSRTGFAKSSIHCLLITFERRGYIHRNERTGRYMFGTRLFNLANTTLIGLRLREQATPYLRALTQSTGLTAHMAILDKGEAVLISKSEPIDTLRLATWIGKRMDVHCTSLGKALLCMLPESEVQNIVKSHGMPRHNENTIASTKKLLQELQVCAKQGYCLDDEEDEIGHRCIGVPILDDQGRPIAAISVSGSTTQVSRDNIKFLSQVLKDTAIKISRAIGDAHTEVM